MSLPLDFDSTDGVKLVQNAYQNCDDFMTPRLTQYQRDIDLYNAYLDMTNRDSTLPQIALPKMFTICETKAPRDTKALFGRRPVLSWTSNRKEFKPISKIQVVYTDDLLSKARQYVHGSLLIKMKMLYGTAYQNVIPYYEKVIEKSLTIDPRLGIVPQQKEAYRLRLKIETWAPWEVYVDPAATSLEEPGSCRYIIKIQMTTKSAIKALHAKGAYPVLDLDKLEQPAVTNLSSGRYMSQHWGVKMLKDFGLNFPDDDNDLGILLRYESPDRYIDLWNGDVVLRDDDNPYNMKKINLSRIIHTQAPHTANQFHGIGEAKPNEVLISMLNDTQSLTFGSHGLINQPVVFFRKSALDVDDLIWGMGQRIPISSQSDRPISDDIQVSSGESLPKEHYLLKQSLEGDIQDTSGLHNVNQGKELEGGTGTATEVSILKETGDDRQEGSIKLGELMFLADYTTKVTSIIEQFSSFEDIAECCGEQDALKVYTANPEDMPGGYNNTFKGSDYVSNILVKQRNFKEVLPFILQAPAAKVDSITRKLLELHQFDDDEIAELMYTEEEMALLYQQQAAMLAGQAGLEAEQTGFDRSQQPTGGQPGGRFSVNSQQNEHKKQNENRLAAFGQGRSR